MQKNKMNMKIMEYISLILSCQCLYGYALAESHKPLITDDDVYLKMIVVKIETRRIDGCDLQCAIFDKMKSDGLNNDDEAILQDDKSISYKIKVPDDGSQAFIYSLDTDINSYLGKCFIVLKSNEILVIERTIDNLTINKIPNLNLNDLPLLNKPNVFSAQYTCIGCGALLRYTGKTNSICYESYPEFENIFKRYNNSNCRHYWRFVSAIHESLCSDGVYMFLPNTVRIIGRRIDFKLAFQYLEKEKPEIASKLFIKYLSAYNCISDEDEMITVKISLKIIMQLVLILKSESQPFSSDKYKQWETNYFKE